MIRGYYHVSAGVERVFVEPDGKEGGEVADVDRVGKPVEEHGIHLAAGLESQDSVALAGKLEGDVSHAGRRVDDPARSVGQKGSDKGRLPLGIAGTRVEGSK
jgi:hypothetical protein